MLEPGVDGGGLLKEFLNVLTKKMFDTQTGYFKELDNKTIFFNHAFDSDIKRIQMYQFIGKITAKAIYEEILIEPILSKVILNMLLQKRNEFNDLKELD